MRIAWWMALGACLGSGGGDEFARGERAYRAGQFAAAQAAFAAAVAACGDVVPAELSYDLALAALAAGDLAAAAAAIDGVADGASAAMARRRAFVRGSIAWARGEATARLAEQPEAEPFVFAQAIDRIAAARTHWLEAALGPDDWPAARRNVERAQRRLDELRALQQRRAEQRRSAAAQQRPMLVPNDNGEPRDRDGKASGGAGEIVDNPLQPQTDELSAAEVSALLERLDRREQQKRALRRAQHGAASGSVERDW